MIEMTRLYGVIGRCIHLIKMDAKKDRSCACCGNRVGLSGRRSLNHRCLRLFVAARVYPSLNPIDGFICSKCRSMYNRWKSLPEVHSILATIDSDDDQEMPVPSVVNLIGDSTNDDERMVDDDNPGGSGNDHHFMDQSKGDDEPVHDAVSEDDAQDEEMHTDMSRETVSVLKSFVISYDT
jgi:hypothetical protein